MSDPRIAAAIATAETSARLASAPVIVRMTLGEGRSFAVEVPGDIQVVEVLAMVAWLAGGGLGTELAKTSPAARLKI